MKAPPDSLSGYVEVTLEALTLAHLQDCSAQLRSAAEHPIRLFLAARSAHLALVTALTAAVAGSASIGAFPKDVRAAWLRYFEDTRNGLAEHPEDDRVMGFYGLLLLARTGPAGWLQEPLDVGMVDEYQLFRLTKLRDRTEHPRPETHLIEPALITRAIEAGTRWAIFCLQAVWHRLEPDDCERALADFAAIGEHCRELQGAGLP